MAISTLYSYQHVLRGRYCTVETCASLIQMNLGYCSTSGMQPSVMSQRVQIRPIYDNASTSPNRLFIFLPVEHFAWKPKTSTCSETQKTQRPNLIMPKPKSRGRHWDLSQPQPEQHEQQEQLGRPPDGSHAFWTSSHFFPVVVKPSPGLWLEQATTTRGCKTFISILFTRLPDGRSGYRDHKWIWAAHSGTIICANILQREARPFQSRSVSFRITKIETSEFSHRAPGLTWLAYLNLCRFYLT